MRSRWLLVAVAALALAGCLGGSSPGEEVEPANATPDAEKNLTREQVYAFEDVVVGADAHDPEGEGSLAESAPPARVDTFTVPGATERVTIDGHIDGGSGTARVEIYDADDQRVWESAGYTTVGAPGTYAGLIADGDGRSGELAPGEYEVRYHVAGAFGVTMEITSLQPANAAS
jgi:hypothetical protein